MDPLVLKVICSLNHIVLGHRMRKAQRQLKSPDPEERGKGEAYLRGERIGLGILVAILLIVVLIAFWPIILIGGLIILGLASMSRKKI